MLQDLIHLQKIYNGLGSHDRDMVFLIPGFVSVNVLVVLIDPEKIWYQQSFLEYIKVYIYIYIYSLILKNAEMYPQCMYVKECTQTHTHTHTHTQIKSHTQPCTHTSKYTGCFCFSFLSHSFYSHVYILTDECSLTYIHMSIQRGTE